MTKPNNKSLSINKGSERAESINPNFKLKRSQLKKREEYVEGIKSGNRSVLSQVITFIESSKKEYRNLGQQILEEVMPLTGNSVRIGITGVPGVGKSTFIETMGKLLINQGKKLAVLTIDPSSSRSKGSILGDKTRMPFLSTNDNAYIRPSPTSGTLGGVARKTREAMLLCEAAGYDTIIIETVGVGQSETSVHSMVDFFLLLMLPGAGDELQGIKRGIMEMADLIAINKSEGENIQAAKRAKQEYENALSLFPPAPSKWKTPVVACSALKGDGIDDLWKEIKRYIKLSKENNYFSQKREEQFIEWINEEIQSKLTDSFFRHPGVENEIDELKNRIKEGSISPYKAASKLFDIYKLKQK